MKRYSVRPATFADIDAVCSLIAKQNGADYAELRHGDSLFIYLDAPSHMDLGFQLLPISEENA